jgi:hypothetical protein
MKSIFNLFKRRPIKAQTNNPAMKRLLQSLAMTDEQELSCDDVFALLDQFAEMVKRGEDTAEYMPLVQKHLTMCPDCREEYETLLRIMDDPVE